jgi:hypothetical protein
VVASVIPNPPPTKFPVHAILTSGDGGHSWYAVHATVPALGGIPLTQNGDITGNRGDWANAIAVSPFSSKVVVLGWQNGFISQDGGLTWNQLGPTSPHLHSDIHAMVFDADNRLYIGSDGGCATTPDLGATFGSSMNTFLLNLQFESFPERQTWGRSDASPTVPGLTAGGLQDNGVVYCIAGSTPWHELITGDGALGVFLPQGELVASTASGNPARISSWNGTALSDAVDIPLIDPSGHSQPGLINPITEAVDSPSLRVGNKVLSAVGGNGQQSNVLYGLFTDDAGGDPLWEPLATLAPASAQIWSMAALDASTFFVGAAAPASVYHVDAATHTTAVLPAPTPITAHDGNPVLARIVKLDGRTLIAAYNTDSAGQLLRFTWDGTVPGLASGKWEQLGFPEPNAWIYGLAADTYGTLYASTDAHVYEGTNQGDTWNDVSTGLPQRPHSAEIRFRQRADGSSSLHLVTYGRSLWRRVTHPPQADGRGVAFNKLIGSLADGPLWQLVGQGLVPVGPIDPELSGQLRIAYEQLVAGTLAIAEQRVQFDQELHQGPMPAHAALRESIDSLTLAVAQLQSLAAVPDARKLPVERLAQLTRASQLITHLVGGLPALITVAATNDGPAGKALAATADALARAVKILTFLETKIAK